MVTAEIIGATKVLSFMESMKSGVKAGVKQEMSRQVIALQNKVVQDFLNGQALHVRTGHLRRSITSKTTEADGHFEGIVGTNLKYGAAWELGFDRKVGMGARGGTYEKLCEAARARQAAKHPLGTKHYDASPFLVPALQAMTPAIRVALEAAIARAVKK